MTDARALVAFTVYTLAWQALTWIGGIYVIIRHDWSQAWVLFLVIMSSAQFKPSIFAQFRTDRKDGHE